MIFIRMEQSEKGVGNTSNLGSSTRGMPGEVPTNKQNIEGSFARKVARKKESTRRVLARLQAARNSLRYCGRSVRTINQTPLPTLEEELNDESTEAETLNDDVKRWARRVLIPLAILAWAGVAIIILMAAGYVSRTILLLIIAMLLAYALSPLVTLFERVMPRFLAILIVYLLVFGAIGTMLYFIVLASIDQIISLSHYLGTLFIPGKIAHPSALEQALYSLGITQNQIAAARDRIISQAEGLTGNIVPFVTGVAGTALDMVVVAVMSIYLLIDGRRATNWLRQNMPRRQRGRIRFLLDTLQRVVGGYIRGQLFLWTLIGLLVGIGMQILGVPYALLLGVLAFFLKFIPVLGTLVSGAICVLFVLTKGWLLAVIVLAYFVIAHIIEGDYQKTLTNYSNMPILET
jgi:predicted PurR-regulated permease PerM